jgi:hypothetical protein
MSAPITEAHLRLANQLVASPPSPLVLATLIADSEAAAVEAADFALQQERNIHMTTIAERDQLRAEIARIDSEKPWLKEANATNADLRAEVARLSEWQESVIKNARAHHAHLKDAIARAERAEASLHALRLVCGTTDADKFSTWVDRANARAARAEAELTFQQGRNSRLFEQRDAAVAAQEKAEAELANIRALANRRNKQDHSHDTTHQLVASLDQSLDIVQAELVEERWLKGCAIKRSQELLSELAAERARLDDLVADINDACITLASAAADCDDYAMQNTGFKLEAVRDVLLQYIPNAAMKEGAK